jgi:mevalonate kinase
MSEYVDDEAVAESLRKQYERIGQRLLKKTRAYGKLILFGEHFVVYKVPALVCAVA